MATLHRKAAKDFVVRQTLYRRSRFAMSQPVSESPSVCRSCLGPCLGIRTALPRTLDWPDRNLAWMVFWVSFAPIRQLQKVAAITTKVPKIEFFSDVISFPQRTLLEALLATLPII